MIKGAGLAEPDRIAYSPRGVLFRDGISRPAYDLQFSFGLVLSREERGRPKGTPEDDRYIAKQIIESDQDRDGGKKSLQEHLLPWFIGLIIHQHASIMDMIYAIEFPALWQHFPGFSLHHARLDLV